MDTTNERRDTNERLKRAVIKALLAYNGDTSVSIAVTLQGLIDIRDEVQSMIDAVEEEM